MQAVSVSAFVFVFSFACAFLLGNKRPVLALSTRAALLAAIGLCGAYEVAPVSPLHLVYGATGALAAALFVLFGAIDFIRFRVAE